MGDHARSPGAVGLFVLLSLSIYVYMGLFFVFGFSNIASYSDHDGRFAAQVSRTPCGSFLYVDQS